MSELLDLAARCEAAEGPDANLDRDIRRAWKIDASPSNFTASLDAAMTLVPEGWITDLCVRLGDEQHECKLHEWPLPCRKTPLVQAATPALALCAAALRARAATPSPNALPQPLEDVG